MRELQIDSCKDKLHALVISETKAAADCRTRLRGLSFLMVTEFDFETALIEKDSRTNYGEDRWIALGLIGSRAFVVAFTWRRRLRVISFRKANSRESIRYAQAQP